MQSRTIRGPLLNLFLFPTVPSQNELVLGQERGYVKMSYQGNVNLMSLMLKLPLVPVSVLWYGITYHSKTTDTVVSTYRAMT